MPVITVSAGKVKEETVPIVNELKLKLLLNGTDLVSLMCLPEKLEELAAGFLFSEGFIKEKQDIDSIKVNLPESTIEVSASIVEGSFEMFKEHSALVSGCGRGVSGAEADRLVNCKRIDTTLRVSSETLLQLSKMFQKHSSLYAETGGVHNTAIVDNGGILISADDIGRHNAVDKVIGEALLKEIDLSDKMMITTGRVSSENGPWLYVDQRNRASGQIGFYRRQGKRDKRTFFRSGGIKGQGNRHGRRV